MTPRRDTLLALAARAEGGETGDTFDREICAAAGVKWDSDEGGQFGGYGLLPRRVWLSRSIDAQEAALPGRIVWSEEQDRWAAIAENGEIAYAPTEKLARLSALLRALAAQEQTP